MQKKFEKGSEEWQMMSDYYKILSDFWVAETTKEYSDSYIESVEKFIEKYGNYDRIFAVTAGNMIYDLIEARQAQLQGKNPVEYIAKRNMGKNNERNCNT